MQRLETSFYQQSTRRLARNLLGKTLVRQLPGGLCLRSIIVEVEAYLSRGDAASHSHRGRTPRNASMFAKPGTLYVYAIHSRHCMNVVTEETGSGAAVLIRAAEPMQGISTMWKHRCPQQPWQTTSPLPRDLLRLTQGPGRLCESLAIAAPDDGECLISSINVWLETSLPITRGKQWMIRRSPRIGIRKAQNLPLRYFMDGHFFVSGCARDHTQGRYWTFTEETKGSP